MSERTVVEIRIKNPASWGDYPAVAALQRQLSCSCEHQDGVWHIVGTPSRGLVDHDIAESLRWLRDNHVPYIAVEESELDLFGFVYVYDGDRLISGRMDDTITMSLQEYNDICAGISEFATVDEFFTDFTRSIEDMSIGHLPQVPPASL